MKQLLALILSVAMLLMTACGSTQDAPAAESIDLEEDNIVFEEFIPEETTLPVVHDNPSLQWEEADIEVFGNVPGIVAGVSEGADLPNMNKDGNRIVFETDKISFIAERNTYLVDGYVEKAEKLLQVMEAATGLAFSSEKLQLFLMDAGNRHSDFDYASGVDAQYRMVQIGQGDAFLGNSYELIAYTAFVLQWDNAPQSFIDVLSSGFATYATYDVLLWLEENDPDFGSAFPGRHMVYSNYYIYDPETLYSQPPAYWMENEYPYSQSNGSPAVGFWLMKYLDDAYGDYTKWITAYDPSVGVLDLNGQLRLLKDAYGEDVLDGFYPWLRENLGKIVGWDMIPDHTAQTEYVYYPILTGMEYPHEMLYGEYGALSISLAECRHYLTQIKEYTVSSLTLIKYTDTALALYDADGHFLEATRGTQLPDGTYLVCLDDAYYIRVLEEGFLQAALTYTKETA